MLLTPLPLSSDTHNRKYATQQPLCVVNSILHSHIFPGCILTRLLVVYCIPPENASLRFACVKRMHNVEHLKKKENAANDVWEPKRLEDDSQGSSVDCRKCLDVLVSTESDVKGHEHAGVTCEALFSPHVFWSSRPQGAPQLFVYWVSRENPSEPQPTVG